MICQMFRICKSLRKLSNWLRAHSFDPFEVESNKRSASVSEFIHYMNRHIYMFQTFWFREATLFGLSSQNGINRIADVKRWFFYCSPLVYVLNFKYDDSCNLIRADGINKSNSYSIHQKGISFGNVGYWGLMAIRIN